MVESKVQETFQFNNVRNQYFSTFTVNLMSLSQGVINGWVSPALGKLSSENTPLPTGPLTSDQISWIGSINCLGALFGVISFGYFLNLVGCKRAMIFSTIPTVAFWGLIYFGNNYYCILIARFFGGLAGGAIPTACVLYVSEISNANVRGRLGSSYTVVRNIGILCGYILGSVVDFAIIPQICVVNPIIFAIIFVMLPNTPEYYIHGDKIQKAENALKFYKGFKGKSEQENDAIYKELERLKSLALERNTKAKLQISDFCNRRAVKGLTIGIALATFTQFTANFTITNYSVLIFAKIGSMCLDPYLSSIILGIALILGSLFTTYLADLIGRKVLNLISLTGCAVFLSTTSLYHYLDLNGYDLKLFSWVPIISLTCVIFISSIGIMPLASVCAVECLPPKIRAVGMGMIQFSINIVAFIFVKSFPILVEIIDLHGFFTICTIGCIIGALFIYFVMDETNGTSLDDVGAEKTTKMTVFPERFTTIDNVF